MHVWRWVYLECGIGCKFWYIFENNSISSYLPPKCGVVYICWHVKVSLPTLSEWKKYIKICFIAVRKDFSDKTNPEEGET